jgi:hypothetical protein
MLFAHMAFRSHLPANLSWFCHELDVLELLFCACTFDLLLASAESLPAVTCPTINKPYELQD